MYLGEVASPATTGGRPGGSPLSLSPVPQLARLAAWATALCLAAAFLLAPAAQAQADSGQGGDQSPADLIKAAERALSQFEDAIKAIAAERQRLADEQQRLTDA